MSDLPNPFGTLQPPREDWLAKLPPEEPLEPDLPIIDSHHHLWNDHRGRYALDEFLADVDCGHNIVATVFEECHAMYREHGPEHLKVLGETEFVVGVAAQSDSGLFGPTRVALGIVGAADLTLGEEVEKTLVEQVRASNGRFRGVRHSACWDDDPNIGYRASRPGMYSEAGFGPGLDVLAGMGLVLDAWVFHTQLDELIDLAADHPDAPIVVCHCGGALGYGPYAKMVEEVRSLWLEKMTTLSKHPNVSVKLGGMMMRLAAFNYFEAPRPPTSEELADLWRPYIEPCIELFGAERCMVESNFPVEKMGVSYGSLWNMFKRITANASESEKMAIYSGTAKRVYKLDV